MARDRHELYEIIDVDDIGQKQRIFTMEGPALNSDPGQFVMAWIPGISENPFSIMLDNGNRIKLCVKNVGDFTEALFRHGEASEIFLRGPYGTSFKPYINDAVDHSKNGNHVYIVAGGCGAVPLVAISTHFHSIDKKPVVFLGAKTSDEIILEDFFKEYAEVYISTDDGSCGRRGLVTDFLDDVSENSYYFVCGNDAMINTSIKKITEKKPLGIVFSLERYIKCGEGRCGGCEIYGHMTCKEGPVFSIQNYPEFRRGLEYKRGKSGIRVDI